MSSNQPTGFWTKDSPEVNYLTSNGGLPFFDYTVDGSGTTTITKQIGVLPAGAKLVSGGVEATVETAFDGTTPVVLVGITGTTNALFQSADITEGTTGIYPAAVASLKTGGFLGPLAADTPIIVTYTVGGSPTAGKVWFVIPYVVKNMRTGT